VTAFHRFYQQSSQLDEMRLLLILKHQPAPGKRDRVQTPGGLWDQDSQARPGLAHHQWCTQKSVALSIGLSIGVTLYIMV